MGGLAVDEPEAREARSTLPRRWFWICLISWLVLVPIAALIGNVEGIGWEILASPVNALAGSFGAVVLGALLFQKWQDRIDAESAAAAEAAWMERNSRYLLEGQAALCRELSRLVEPTYQLLHPVLRDKMVPANLIRADLVRPVRPVSSPSNAQELSVFVAEEIDVVLHALSDGPLALAREQQLDLQRARMAARDEERFPDRAEVFRGLSKGLVPADLHEEDFVAVLDGLTPQFVERLRTSADRILELAPHVSAGDLEPHQIRALVLRVAVGAWALEEQSMATSDPVTQRVSAVLGGISTVVSEARAVHKELWELATKLAAYAQNHPLEAARISDDLLKRLNTRSDGTPLTTILGGTFDRAWDSWRSEHDFHGVRES
ncbi:hypothetical protein NOCA2570035 [metagenome]|uniref:Uncharacterized protein n=1 Tax=metagenome TaxID=256318 RepID=A0A2P2CAU4_9ZZZZ